MKVLVCIFVIVLFFNTSFACIPNISSIKVRELKGRVMDDYNHSIPNAKIQIHKLKESNNEAITEANADENGFFEIKNLPSGKYNLKAKAEYFAASYASLKLNNSSKKTSTEQIIITLVPETDCSGNVEVQKIEKVNKKQLANQVKSEFLHAWNGYKKYAWGHDDLKPLSKTYKDWYGETLLMTPVDSLDSLYLLGFKDEADKTRKYITENLSFDKDIDVQNFEITIRLLGGLLSSYQMTNDKKLLNLAEDLGNRLLPVLTSCPALIRELHGQSIAGRSNHRPPPGRPGKKHRPVRE
ncbi:hypothetical protein BH20ACI1_BH20ACI1_29790 [soil metagenome]